MKQYKRITAVWLIAGLLLGAITPVNATAEVIVPEQFESMEMTADEASEVFEEVDGDLVSDEPAAAWPDADMDLSDGLAAIEINPVEIPIEEIPSVEIPVAEIPETADMVVTPVGEEEEDQKADPETEDGANSTYEVLNGAQDEEILAETEWLEAAATVLAAPEESGKFWTFDMYYVNEESLRDVTKTEDFNLKYQMEFHTSQTLYPGSVIVTVPMKLLNEREGSERPEVLPDDISLMPADTEGLDMTGTNREITAALLADTAKQRWQESGELHFNYYADQQGNLVFFNYETITAGTDVTWQVLYRQLLQMEIPDGTEWILEADIQVKPSEDLPVQEDTARVTGRTDSSVELTGVTKSPVEVRMQPYAPGLYTQAQVKKYIHTFASETWKERIADNSLFSEYRYVVWEVNVKGSGNQPWNLYALDVPSYISDGEQGEGEVVGFIDHSRDGGMCVFKPAAVKELGSNSWQVRSSNVRELVDVCFYVVTAYPASVGDGDLVRNDITIALEPADLVDSVQTKTAHSEWTYRSYYWNYHGNIIGIDKYNRYTREHEQDYYGWLKKYESMRLQNQDAGDLPFETLGRCYGYSYTHGINPEDTETFGRYKEGSYYRITCVDDAVYAFCGDRQVLLDDQDYYFDSVEFVRKDYGYDVWEDTTVDAEHPENLDQTMTVYAMFEGGTDWEAVGTAGFTDKDRAEFVFGEELISRHPYRVKAEYNACSYNTYCTVRVSVCLKASSPVFSAMLYEDGRRNTVSVLQIENLSGIAGQVYGVDGLQDGSYFQDTAVDGDNGHGGTNYSEPGLIDFTRNLYGTILMRDCALKLFTDLHAHAAAIKQAQVSNDPAHRRVLVQYDLTQYDGYDVYAEELIPHLQQMGIESPGLHTVVWYDLLPVGMTFDAAGPIRAGRISALDADRRSWDTRGVTVTVNPLTDITDNWRGTGRTMVALHITYAGEDPAKFTDGLWAQGWGVSFRAYYNWDAIAVNENPVNTNIAAFMPDGALAGTTALPGQKDEVFCDNGHVPETGGYAGFFDTGDLNNDGVRDIPNVLYAKAWAAGDVAVGAKDSIEKKVRADRDVSAPYVTSTAVLPDDMYTYKITVSSAAGLKDLVIFDRLEHALQDRASVPNETFEMENACWYGTFQGLDISEARLMGIEPVVYYHADRDAMIFEPSSRHIPGDVDELLSGNGWMTQEAWKSAGKTDADVKAVAVDLRRTKEGDFTLNKGASVSFKIRMKAPSQTQAQWAYNNPSFFSTRLSETAGAETAYVVGNSVRIALGKRNTLEVEKRCTGDVPAGKAEETFRFTLTRGGEALPNQLYTLMTADGSAVRDAAVQATDAAGQFYLKAGQKAVFENLPAFTAAEYMVEEEESPFWESVKTVTDADEVSRMLFENRYRPVVYVRKFLSGVPQEVVGPDGTAEKMDTTQAEFVFRLVDENNQPMADVPFLYVTGVRTDGSAPQIDRTRGNGGKGKTGADGSFTIQAKDIIALQMDHIGQNYSIEEVTVDTTDQEGRVVFDGEGDNWIVKQERVSGTTAENGTLTTITNYYRWKNLLLNKQILHRALPAVLADDTEFTFKLMHEDGTPVSGNVFRMKGEGGLQTITGILSADGTFSAPCGGRTVQIQGLEAGKTYILQELSSDGVSSYHMVNDGKAVFVMPLYASAKTVSITNAWTKRPLSVKKLVVTDREELQEAAASEKFTFTVTIDDRPYANQPFTVTRNGKSSVGTAETQYAESPGWPASYPAGLSEDNHAGTFSFPGASYVQVTFASGSGTKADVDFVTVRGSSGIQPFDRRLTGSGIGGSVVTVPGDTVTLGLITSTSEGAGYSAVLRPLDAEGKVITKENSIVDPERMLQTDEYGRLELCSGETARFEDVGENGVTAYAVTEEQTEQSIFAQIYPKNQAPSAGILEGSGAAAEFINGTGGVILLSKQITVSSRDNGLGERALKAERTAIEMSGWNTEHIIKPVHFKIEYWLGDGWKQLSESEFLNLGLTVIYPDGTAKKITRYGDRKALYTGGYLTVMADCSYVLSGSMPGDAKKLRVTELQEDQDGVFWYEDEEQSGFVYFGLKKPESGSIILDNTDMEPAAVITNELEGLEEKSIIHKVMRALELPDPEEQLSLYLERYDGIGWSPAEGIVCFEKYTDPAADDQKTAVLQTSDHDGRVILQVRGGMIPELVFPYDKITINPGDPAAGTLRIRETAGRQNGWGILAGYQFSGSGSESSVSLALTDADTFVNDNRSAQIRVQKVVQGDMAGERQTFSFRIDQIIGTEEEKNFTDLTVSDLKDAAPGAGLLYEVYEDSTADSGMQYASDTKPVRTGTVDQDGIFTLQAGQYAVFETAPGSLWRVQEILNVPGYSLAEAAGSQETTARAVAANAVLLKAEERPLLTLYYRDDTDAVERLECLNAADLPLPETNGLSKNGYDFTGWYLDPACEKAAAGTFSEDTAVYGGWKKNHTVKYAVQIYGIRQDVDQNGNLLGLSFGPAIGRSFVSRVNAHTPSTGKLCIHDLTWPEIIAQSGKDPTVFSECLENECTHSVNLMINDMLQAEDLWGNMLNGDGTSVLKRAVKEEYRTYNAMELNAGGWPASRLRAVLNGADTFTDTAVAGSDVPSAQSALFTCFPEELRSGIVPRRVQSETVWNSRLNEPVTTYDLLWLPSLAELFGGTSSNIRAGEGTPYQLILQRGITMTNFRKGILYDENGKSSERWSRTIGTVREDACQRISGAGQSTASIATGIYGISPGFCLR